MPRPTDEDWIGPLYDRYGAWPSMQFATPIRGTALHEQCASLGLVPPEGIDLTSTSAIGRTMSAFSPESDRYDQPRAQALRSYRGPAGDH